MKKLLGISYAAVDCVDWTWEERERESKTIVMGCNKQHERDEERGEN
jgi:hypothetical protein